MTTEGWEYKPGDKVVYSATVVNEGNVKLTQVTVSDDLNGKPATIKDLEPGAKKTVTFDYVIPKDAKKGDLVNRAEVSAQPEGGLDEVTADADVSVSIVEGEATAKIDLPATAQPGDRVKGTVVIVNGRSKDLTGLKFTVLPEGAAAEGTAKRLKAGESLSIAYQYQLPKDAAPGPLSMGLTVSGASGGEDVKLNAVADVEVAGVPKLTARQKAAESTADPGGSVRYQVTVTNEGNVALTGLECTSDLWGITIDPNSIEPSGGASIDAEALDIDRLEPGKSVQYAYSYPVSDAAEAGDFDNNLSVSGRDEVTGKAVSARAVTTATVAAAPAVSLSLAADKDAYAPGEEIQYTLTAQNTGNVPVNDLQLRDLMEGLTLTGIDASDDEGATQPEGEPAVNLPALSTGASLTATFTAAAPEADLTGSQVTVTGDRFQQPLLNRAQVSGKSAVDGKKVSAQAERKVIIQGGIALGAELSADAESYAPGDTARIRVRVYNDGDAALSRITVSNDQSFSFEGKNRASITATENGSGTVIGALRPGEDVTLVYALNIPGDYALNTLDVNVNAASAYATASGALSIPVTAGQVLVAMTAASGEVPAGEAAAFDIAVTNQSSRALYQVDVKAGPDGTFENLPDGVEADGATARIAELAAGQTLHLSYQVPTEASAGNISASVTASGKYDQNLTDSVTASASAGVTLSAPAPTETPAPTPSPAPAPTQQSRLPIDILIAGIAGLALLAAVGLILLSRRKK